MVELIDEAHGGVAQRAALGVAEFVHRGAGDAHRSLRRQIQPAEHLQQGGLAGSGGADDGDAFAAAHRDRGAAQDLQRGRPLDELLDEAGALEDEIIRVGHASKTLQSLRSDSAGARRAARHAG